MSNSTTLKVLIIGAGEVGFRAAERLTMDHRIEVTLIERNPERFTYLRQALNCRLIHDSGLDPDVLRHAGLLSCDLMYAVTDSDEVNLLTCQLAQELVRASFSTDPLIKPEDALHLEHDDAPSLEADCSPLEEGGELKWIPAQSESKRLALFARVRSYALYEHLTHLLTHINTILPEVMCSDKIEEMIRYPQLFDVIELESDLLKLYGVKVHERAPAVGQSLRSFMQHLKLTVAALSRPEVLGSRSRHLKHDRELLIPRADHQMCADDILYFAASPTALAGIYRHFSDPEEPNDPQLVIAGKTSIARDIFHRLVEIDENKERLSSLPHSISILAESDTFTEHLEERDEQGLSTVLSGSITQLENLRSAGVGPLSTLVVCSQDEENLVCALLARELECRHIFVVNNREEYTRLINQLGFDGILSPRQLAVDVIVNQTMRLISRSTHQVASSGDDVEVRSFVIDEDSELCGVALKNLTEHGFPREHAVIAALRKPHEDAHIMPAGDDCFEAHSTVYVVARSEHFHSIQSLFGKRKYRFKLRWP